MLKILCFILLIMGGFIYCQNPNDDNNRYLLGENYEQAGYPDKAKEIYEDLYKKNSSNPEYFISLNRIYVLLKKYDASIKLLEQKLSINPQDINLIEASYFFNKTYILL